MAGPAPAYVSFPARLRRRLASPSLPIVAVLFGAILDFGSTNPASALFWAALQCACAAYALTRRGADLATPSRLDALAGLLYLALLALVGLSLTSAFPLPGLEVGTVDRQATLVELTRLIGLAGFCVAGFAVASDEVEGERLFNWILLAGGLYAAWAVTMFLVSPAFVHGLEKQLHLERLTGSFLSANTAGSLFGALGCALAVRLFRRVGRRLGARVSSEAEDWAIWRGEVRDMALLAVLWLALLLTVSRAALAASLGVLAVFALLELRRYARRRRLKGRALAITGTAVAAGLVLIIAGSLSSQLQGQFGRLATDAVSRTAILEAYRPQLESTPLTGYGLGAFPALNAQVITETNFPALWSLGAAHNILLQWWLEAGPIGAGLACAVVLILLARLAIRHSLGRTGRWRAGAALAASGVLLAHNSVDYSLEVQAVAALWALLIGFGLAERARGDAP